MRFNQQQRGYRTGPAKTAPAMDQDVISLFDHLRNPGSHLSPDIVKGLIRCCHILNRKVEPFHSTIKHGMP